MIQALAELSHTPDQWQMPIKTPLGQMTLVADEHGLQGAWFEHQAHIPSLSHLRWGPNMHWLCEARKQLSEYFAGRRQQFELPLRPYGGSEFQHKVWQALAQIPFGRFASYADIARHLGQPQAARAIGMAVGDVPGRLSWLVFAAMGWAVAQSLGGKPVGNNRFYGANDPRRNTGLALGY